MKHYRRKDYGWQLRESAEKYDLELLAASGVRCLMDVVLAEMALRDIDLQLQMTGHQLGTCVEVEHGIMVTAQRRNKNRA